MDRIFVTGAAGFIGLELCRALRVQYPTTYIYGLCRSEKQAQALRAAEVDPVLGDLSDPQGFREQILQCRLVFHLGANATFGGSVDYTEANLKPTMKLVDLLKESQVLSRLIFTSTIGAVDRAKDDPCTSPLTADSACNPVSDYGKSKLACEEYVRKSGLPYTIVRPSWVYGRGMRRNSHIAALTEKALNGSPITRLNLPGRVSVIHVSDMARMLVAASSSPLTLNQTYFGDDGTPRSFGEIFKAAHLYLESGKTVFTPPAFTISLANRVSRYLPFTLRCLLQDVLTCSEPLPESLGVKPTVSFADGMRETVEYVRQKTRGVYLITGAASGIGRAYAVEFARRGKTLVLVDRNDDVQKLANELGQTAIVCDLSARDAAQNIFQEMNRRDLFVEGLVNCAGIGLRGEIDEHTPAQIDAIIQVNVTALAQLCSLFLPRMKREANGVIINVASSVATVPLPGMALYAASKAAVRSLSLALWGEVSGTGVKVLTVLPSGTKTSFQQNAGVKVVNEGRGLLTPEEVVTQSLKALEKGRAVELVGKKSLVLIGIGKLMPAKLEVLYWKFMFRMAR